MSTALRAWAAWDGSGALRPRRLPARARRARRSATRTQFVSAGASSQARARLTRRASPLAEADAHALIDLEAEARRRVRRGVECRAPCRRGLPDAPGVTPETSPTRQHGVSDAPRRRPCARAPAGVGAGGSAITTASPSRGWNRPVSQSQLASSDCAPAREGAQLALEQLAHALCRSGPRAAARTSAYQPRQPARGVPSRSAAPARSAALDARAGCRLARRGLAVGRRAGEKLVKHDPEPEQIAARIDPLAEQLLRRDVRRRADRGARPGQAVAGCVDRDPEVGDLHVAVAAQEDVRGLQVAGTMPRAWIASSPRASSSATSAASRHGKRCVCPSASRRSTPSTYSCAM